MTYHCPVPGIDIEYTVVEGIPAMELSINERLLASWSEWMATKVTLYLYEEDDPEESQEDFDIGVELEED